MFAVVGWTAFEVASAAMAIGRASPRGVGTTATKPTAPVSAITEATTFSSVVTLLTRDVHFR